jgi:hypothetical protein
MSLAGRGDVRGGSGVLGGAGGDILAWRSGEVERRVVEVL